MDAGPNPLASPSPRLPTPAVAAAARTQTLTEAYTAGARIVAIFEAIGAPFEPHEVKIRPQGGRQLKYVTARTIMNRLDETIGPENWWDEYEQGERSVVCKLTLRLPDGRLLTKMDVGGHAGMQDEGDDEKSGFSDAFKRAAAKFGAGRCLYGDGAPRFERRLEMLAALERNDVPRSSFDSQRPRPESRPQFAPPSESTNSAEAAAVDHPEQDQDDGVATSDADRRRRPASHPSHASPQTPPSPVAQAPKTGTQLWAWAKDRQTGGDARIIAFLTSLGKEDGWPARIVDWSREDVAEAWAAIQRRQAGAEQGPKRGHDLEPTQISIPSPPRSTAPRR